MVMKVKRDNHSNGFCGPAALSLLTGRHVDEAVAQLRINRRNDSPQRRHVIRGVRTYEILEVLKQWGFQSKPLHAKSNWPQRRVRVKPWFGEREAFDFAGPTLAQFLRFTRSRTPDQKFFLVTISHFLVVRGRKVYDNNHPEGIFIRQYAHRRVRVRQAYEVIG